ncbi:MAG: DUF3467 domain-containing protein [Bacteroidales bacterium]|nr:DUF3467 domain-containing protein [Bacteroidales bacterium]
MPQEKQPQNINLSINDEVSQGTYCNLALITHSPAEFILDFAQALPGKEGATVRQRIIMPPIHAKRLLMALSENVRKYEDNFGTIDEPHGPHDAIPYDMVPQGKA